MSSIYKRPIFSLFVHEEPPVEATGDPDYTKAMRSGKLLASGEAGYYDIQSQSHEIERVHPKGGNRTKPKGKGIDHHYPNPPQIQSISPTEFRQNAEYWGIPQNGSQTKAFYQSGIYVAPNDSAKCLDYYYKLQEPEDSCPASAHSGIFHFNEGSGKFSNGFNTVKNSDDCLPKPWNFSISKPLYLSREMIMIHKGTGVPGTTGNAVVIPYLGDFEKLKTKPPLRYYEDANKEFKSDIEKFLEGQDIEEIQEEENDEQ